MLQEPPLARPLTLEESKRIQEGQSRETLAKERFWPMRPDDIAVLPLVENKAGILYILEYKRTSDFTDQYLLRAQSTAENQYASLRSALCEVIQRQGWKVEQISFETGSPSVNEQDLRKNLKFFRVPEAGIKAIYSKLAKRADVYSNVLRCMYTLYSTRFDGVTTRSGVFSQNDRHFCHPPCSHPKKAEKQNKAFFPGGNHPTLPIFPREIPE